jgi:hypothetical protein
MAGDVSLDSFGMCDLRRVKAPLFSNLVINTRCKEVFLRYVTHENITDKLVKLPIHL